MLSARFESLVSFCAGTRLNAIDPMGPDRLIRPEIDADHHRRRRPDELLANLELKPVLLVARKPHLEIAGGGRAAPGIGQDNGGPPPLPCRRLHFGKPG